MNNFLLISMVISAVTFFSGCSNDDDDLPPVDTRDSITTSYVRDVLSDNFSIPFNTIKSIIVHNDGLDGSAVDIDRVIVTRAENAATGDLLSFAYDGVMLEALPVGTIAALYMDMDDGLTGFAIGNINANYLLVNANKTDATVPDFALYQYDGSAWIPRTFNQQYYNFEFVELGFKEVNLPDTDDASELLGQTGVRAILTLQSYKDRDVNDVLSTTDQTKSFTMDIP